MLFSSRLRVKVWFTFSVWLVSGYAHVFILLSVVVVTLPTRWVDEIPLEQNFHRPFFSIFSRKQFSLKCGNF